MTGWLARDGRFELEMTTDLDALASLPNGNYAAVVVYATGFVDDLTGKREQGLLDFIKNGGGFVSIHSAADSFRGSRAPVTVTDVELDDRYRWPNGRFRPQSWYPRNLR